MVDEKVPFAHAPNAIDDGENVTANDFWALLGQRVVGSTIVTVDGAGGPAGFLGLSASHVTSTPPTMVVSIDGKTSACAEIRRQRRFAINYLPATSQNLVDLFSGKAGVKGASRFSEGDWTSLKTGCPIYRDALGAADCQVEEIFDRHGVAIVLGRVVATMIKEDGIPLVHYHGRIVAFDQNGITI
ncbi:MAG: flavin reductase [Mesorhizobium sp.]|uniref:flavin reductase family protein n=1 Tax=Mesorhizobium sp. TaxID=1871066 RepID=UPI000FE9EDAD|nr:flavin reductase family protein [Mesorhizobium sp.]RWB32205.1 MAG: flavin reductase [Mesorhizobium sp.]RWB79875.1 MAG: flavin reductase [Mesorhizobium sp.]TIS68518.1 MAG: flavin reductase [Mesorhizobium sp.]